MADHSRMKLGRRPKRLDPRTLKMAKYLAAAPLTPPAAVDYTRGVTDWGMMLNAEFGCCTIAAVGHAVQAWTNCATGRETTVPDSTILEYYEKWDGYNPSDPSTDQGGVELDVLNKWRQQKFAANILDAYAAIDPKKQQEVQLAIWLFGGAYIGIELPIRAQTQDVWDVPESLGPDDEPGSWGGHAVFVVGYDATGVTLITWGAPKKATWAWISKYCDEAYALISEDWLETIGISPSGFDLAQLAADLALVTE